MTLHIFFIAAHEDKIVFLLCISHFIHLMFQPSAHAIYSFFYSQFSLVSYYIHYFTNKGLSSQSYSFSSSHVWMWELDHKEGWEVKNWCFWTVVLEKTLESPLDCKEIKPVNPKGNQSCVFIGRTDIEAETPILWPPDVKSWLIWKDSDAGKDWGQEEKGTTEDEMVGWHQQLDGHGLGWTLGDGDGQGGLACSGPWGHKESDNDWETLLRYLPEVPKGSHCYQLIIYPIKKCIYMGNSFVVQSLGL